MSKQIATALYWVGVLIALPFALLVVVSIMRMFTDAFEAKYVSSALLGVFGAIFSYSVGHMLRNMLNQDNR